MQATLIDPYCGNIKPQNLEVRMDEPDSDEYKAFVHRIHVDDTFSPSQIEIISLMLRQVEEQAMKNRSAAIKALIG
jgi:hypothetical protein